MRTLFDADARTHFQRRVTILKPDAPARWGRFTAPKMLAHVNDGLRMALGDLPTKSRNLPVRYPPLKQLLIYVLPFPKGLPTAPELLARTDQAQFESERETFPLLLERVGARATAASSWPDHPAFGPMSRRDWGVLGYRHIHHHFTQFGV